MTDEMWNVEELAEDIQFNAELRPQRSEAGAPTRVTVENRGKSGQVFTLTWRSLDDGLDFEPLPTQQLHVPPGEVAMAECSAKPRNRPLIGGEWVLPFTTRVQSAAGGVQNLNGEVVARALIPTWVPIAVLALLVACTCLCVMGAGVLGILDQSQPAAPTAEQLPAEQPTELPPQQPAAPAVTAAPVEPGVPAEPAEPAAPAEPVEPGVPAEPVEPAVPAEPAEPGAPAEPAEPPAGEQPPVAGQLPAEEGTGGLPCIPLAGGLFLAPLLVMGKQGSNRQSSNR